MTSAAGFALAALTENAGVLTLDLRTNIRVRRLGGILLLMLAAFFYFAREPQGLDIVALVVGACLLILGLYLVAERHLLVVDPTRRSITRRRGVLLTFRRASVATTGARSITLAPFARGPNDADNDEQWYRLRAKGVRPGTLAELSCPWQARHVAEQICVALNLPFDNRVYGKSSVREASELDLSVAERWRAHGVVHERPAQPLESTILIEEHDTGVRVTVRTQNSAGLKVIAIVAAVFAVMGVVFYQFIDSLGEWISLSLFFGFSGVVLAFGMLSSSGSSRLVFSATRLTVRLGRWPFTFSMPLASIEEMIPGGGGIDFVGDSTALHVDWPRSRGDREFLQAYVAYELGRRYRPPAWITPPA